MQVVLHSAEKPDGCKSPGKYWLCKCDCGNKYVQSAKKIKVNKSCGCLSKNEDYTGQVFGRLTALTYRGHSKWTCLCSCGKLVDVNTRDLKNGNTKSCGCYKQERLYEANTTHGISIKHPIYRSWTHMKSRCYNVNVYAYQYYGARGIEVCDEWLHDFKAFYDWSMANGWKEGLSIDRIDNDGPYAPWNCRWADNITQANNKRNNRIISINGVSKTVKQWADANGIDAKLIYSRLDEGWTPEKAVFIKKEDVARKCDRPITFNGITKLQTEWSRELFNKDNIVSNRLSLGWTVEQALTLPLHSTIVNTKSLTCDGVTHTLSEWAKITGINRKCLETRFDRGWDPERILKTPVHKKLNNIKLE